MMKVKVPAGPTMTVREAARLLKMGRDQAYAAAHRGEIPVIKMGRRLLVPTAKLLRLLGLDEKAA
jgi:excisionase family DNA binding protein